MQDTKHIWIWVGVAVVVVAVIFTFIWKPSAKAPTVEAPTVSANPVPAPYGQLPAGFPKQLLLDGMSDVTFSSSVGTSSSAGYFARATINAPTSMSALYYSYMQYFLHNGWAIMNTVTNDPGSRNLYAATASSTVEVDLVAQGTGSQVTLVYGTK